MARPMKMVKMSTGDISHRKRALKESAETMIHSGTTDLLEDSVSRLLDGADAKKEYKRVLNLLIGLDVIDNLDRNDLIVYANSYATYMRAHRQIKKRDFDMTERTASGGTKSNPLYRIEQDAYAEMCRAADRCGISQSARLKLATQKVQEEQDSMKAEFGI